MSAQADDSFPACRLFSSPATYLYADCATPEAIDAAPDATDVAALNAPWASPHHSICLDTP